MYVHLQVLLARASPVLSIAALALLTFKISRGKKKRKKEGKTDTKKEEKKQRKKNGKNVTPLDD